ncbi:MAG: hypothetical protein K2X01_08140 [Cyanobacteria bacterium]|nr:hypothetical protein [Cyanobacteriota bacterium]
MTQEKRYAPQRWYDQDPALSQALNHLRNASDRYQAQVALNIIKIIIEHQIEGDGETTIEDMNKVVDEKPGEVDPHLRRRWYDVNESLRSAMHLLRDCPDELQKSLIPTISRMIEETLGDNEP